MSFNDLDHLRILTLQKWRKLFPVCLFSDADLHSICICKWWFNPESALLYSNELVVGYLVGGACVSPWKWELDGDVKERDIDFGHVTSFDWLSTALTLAVVEWCRHFGVASEWIVCTFTWPRRIGIWWIFSRLL